jgi:hypothetical protein
MRLNLFSSGTNTRNGTSGADGIDVNYGAAPDLQLAAVVPLDFDRPAGGETTSGLGRILPTGISEYGKPYVSLLLPIWIGKDWGRWSTFGGGGCELNRGRDSRNFCMVGWVLTRIVFRKLAIGAELTHEVADIQGGQATTGVGADLHYDLSEYFHLLGSDGPGIQNARDTNRYSWYAALLFSY